MNLETKITIYKFTPQLFTLTRKSPVKHLRASTGLPFFRSYIFAAYKKEALWFRRTWERFLEALKLSPITPTPSPTKQ